MRRGQALAGLGRQDEALREYEAAERLMEQQDNDRYLAMLLPARAEALEVSGQTDRALAEYRRFITRRFTGPRPVAATGWSATACPAEFVKPATAEQSSG